VIHGPFIETEVQNPDLNTEVQNVDLNTEVQNIDLNAEYVEDSEPVESMALITAATCEYEPEVVLDSEDEEMNNTGKVTVAERFLEDGSSPVVNNSLVLFKKKLPKLPCEQANSKSNAATSGKSGTGMCLFINRLTNLRGSFGLFKITLAYIFCMVSLYAIVALTDFYTL
jgi:hypothetical protein